jgi:hypothetical protein
MIVEAVLVESMVYPVLNLQWKRIHRVKRNQTTTTNERSCSPAQKLSEVVGSNSPWHSTSGHPKNYSDIKRLSTPDAGEELVDTQS